MNNVLQKTNDSLTNECDIHNVDSVDQTNHGQTEVTALGCDEGSLWDDIGGSTVGTAPRNVVSLAEMLGMRDTEMSETLWNEENCTYCGIKHRNPVLMDLYCYCGNCGCCMREPSILRKHYTGQPPEFPLEILIAAYGEDAMDGMDISTAINITVALVNLVRDTEKKDRLSIRKSVKLDHFFGSDPAPGRLKQIRVRYRMLGRHGLIVLPVLENNTLPQSLLLLCPQQRLLTITRGTYGHPRGRSSTGRMSHDVTESLQGMADFAGGSYLRIDTDVLLAAHFGDPCRGYRKDLRIDYDISGKRDVVTVLEVRGEHLKHSLHVTTGATIAPMLVVESATYGLSESGKKDREKQLQDDLSRCKLIEYRRRLQLPIKPAELQLLRRKKTLSDELANIGSTPIVTLDVAQHLQRLADEQGGMVLSLKKAETDLNEMFGNPCPGFTKMLEAEVFCQGGDSEAATSSDEVTAFGYPKNVIAQKLSRINIPVRDDDNGRGVLDEDLYVRSHNAFPMLLVENAQYESQFDPSKGFNVTTTVQRFGRGRILHLDDSVNLNAIFGDPALGVRKQLVVRYVTRGYKGSIRVQDRDGFLQARLELGFPPTPPPDL